MNIKIIESSNVKENIYIYYNEETKEAVVIDPGSSADKILEFINENSLVLCVVLLTHGHFDHIGGVSRLQSEGIKISAHTDEVEILSDIKKNFSKDITVTCDVLFSDGDIIKVNGIELTVIHTPGHTSGSVCYYDGKNGVLFSGDTLFEESIGRTDFYSGNIHEIIHSIKNKLYTLPDDTVVYPGHGKKTTIKHEKRYNPFVSEDHS